MDNRPDVDRKLNAQNTDRESDRFNDLNVSRECSWETGEHHGKPYFKSSVLEGFCEQSEESRNEG
jgi:hypothetical protein